MPVIIYTDGAADPNPGVGGWAAVLRSGEHEHVLSGNAPHTTNNRMELTAAIEALRALNRPSQVELHTDSTYVQRGISEWCAKWAAQGWQRRGEPIPNADLWQALWQLTRQHQIDWRWVRGHTGDVLNERVDALAREARLALAPKPEQSAEPWQLFLRACCLGNPGPGGWGVAAREADGQSHAWSGAVPQTTNNRMELLAAVEALRRIPPDQPIALATPSEYLFRGASQWLGGWRRRNWRKQDGSPLQHADLWQQLDALLAGRTVRWRDARGQTSAELEEAGALALQAAQALRAEGQSRSAVRRPRSDS